MRELESSDGEFVEMLASSVSSTVFAENTYYRLANGSFDDEVESVRLRTLSFRLEAEKGLRSDDTAKFALYHVCASLGVLNRGICEGFMEGRSSDDLSSMHSGAADSELKNAEISDIASQLGYNVDLDSMREDLARLNGFSVLFYENRAKVLDSWYFSIVRTMLELGGLAYASIAPMRVMGYKRVGRCFDILHEFVQLLSEVICSIPMEKSDFSDEVSTYIDVLSNLVSNYGDGVVPVCVGDLSQTVEDFGDFTAALGVQALWAFGRIQGKDAVRLLRFGHTCDECLRLLSVYVQCVFDMKASAYYRLLHDLTVLVLFACTEVDRVSGGGGHGVFLEYCRKLEGFLGALQDGISGDYNWGGLSFR